MQSLFYQNNEEPNGSFTRHGKLHELTKQITLHPVKDPKHLYRIYNHFQSVEVSDRRHREKLLRREVYAMDLLLWNLTKEWNATRPTEIAKKQLLNIQKFKPSSVEEIIRWNCLHRHFYTADELNPKRGVDKAFHNALHKSVIGVMRLINGDTREKGRTIDYKDILHGYHRVDPVNGVDYILDLLLLYKKYKGKRKLINVRRYTYFHQSFSDLEILLDKNSDLARESMLADTIPGKIGGDKLKFHVTDKVKNIFRYFSGILSPNRMEMISGREQMFGSRLKPTVHFILPIVGRVKIFRRFLTNFEREFLSKNESVSLSVMMFKIDNEDGKIEAALINKLVNKLKINYPSVEINVRPVEGAFSRSVALDLGSQNRKNDDLLFFVDVDIHMSTDILNRIRSNTVRNKQVYFPIVFSQYDPEIVCRLHACGDNPFMFARWRGYWRSFGFGISSIYKRDFVEVGGFNTTIQGWGLEDIDIFDRTLLKFQVFRAPDLGMVHIFHPINCDTNLPKNQYNMCLGSKASSLSSRRDLTELINGLPTTKEGRS